MGDWTDHLSTAFPEVRMKSFLEMRGADGGPWNRICALPAFWVGLLYDDGALDAAWDVVKDWSMEDARDAASTTCPASASMRRSRGGRTLRDIAGQVLDISRSGLAARARLNSVGDNESGYLSALDEVVAQRPHPCRAAAGALSSARGAGDLSRVYAPRKLLEFQVLVRSGDP